MASNLIEETEFIPKKEIRQLPDRSDLSGLYFKTNMGYQKGSINFESTSNESSRQQYMKYINRNFAKIGFLAPLPISTAIFLYSYLSGWDSIKQNAMIGLPIVITSIFIASVITSLAYKKIKNILEKLGISSSYFFTYMTLCMGLIYAPAFFAGALFENIFLTHLAAYIFVAAFCILITKILLVALGDEKINSRVSTILKGIPLAICLVVAVIFSLYLF